MIRMSKGSNGVSQIHGAAGGEADLQGAAEVWSARDHQLLGGDMGRRPWMDLWLAHLPSGNLLHSY